RPRERRRRATRPSRMPRRPTAHHQRATPQRATPPPPRLTRRSRKTEQVLEVLAERFREIGPAHREVDDRLQKSQLVAGIVSNAVDLVRDGRPGEGGGREA